MATKRLTSAEMSVLHAAWRNRENYQPPEDALATANSLYDRGLLEHDPAWPHVTAISDKGEEAYTAEIDALVAEHGDDWVAVHFR
jgi:hypothetical protein